MKSVFIQEVEKPVRKVIIKRSVKAADYFSCCEEVGCDVWGLLTSMKSLEGESVCMWLPPKYRLPDNSEYVQGVEVAADYSACVPSGFNVISLPEAKYLMFRGPLAEEKYCEAIWDVQNAIDKYDPGILGYDWDVQLEHIGERGYIKLRAVKGLL